MPYMFWSIFSNMTTLCKVLYSVHQDRNISICNHFIQGKRHPTTAPVGALSVILKILSSMWFSHNLFTVIQHTCPCKWYSFSQHECPRSRRALRNNKTLYNQSPHSWHYSPVVELKKYYISTLTVRCRRITAQTSYEHALTEIGFFHERKMQIGSNSKGDSFLCVCVS